MKLWILAVMTIVFSGGAFAQTMEMKLDEAGYADHNVFLGSGVRSAAFGTGLFVQGGFLVTDQLLLGSSLFYGNNSDDKSGGSLDNAQYYDESFDVKTTTADLNATYYFRENGYARWGFLMRGGIGHAWQRGIAKWSRYDRSPAFIIIGSDKRLRESGEVRKDWDSTFARLGAYYQFLWGFKKHNRVGHILELGLGGIAFDTGRELSYSKPNGDSRTKEVSRVSSVAEISYALAF